MSCKYSALEHLKLRAADIIITFFHAGIAQLVEHNLAKVGVAGSNPVSRSINYRG